MAKLVICEKPSVAEKVAHALGESGQAERKSLYGVSYYEAKRNGTHITVVSAVGHLYTLHETTHFLLGQKGAPSASSLGSKSDAFSAGKSTSPEAKREGGRGYPVFDIDWAPNYEVDSDSAYSKKYLDAIKKLGAGADEYICACDFDIEGSLIGYNIIRFGCNSEHGTRMKFSALTEEDLEEAYDQRSDFDTPNALAGEARHMLDWFYGINLSRALMACIREAGASYKQIMSIGRVQGPALAILAKKEKSIAAFISQPYWELKCMAKNVQFEHAHGRFMDKAAAKAALENSKSPGTVKKVERKEYSQPPPPPFDLTSLQVEAYHLFGFAPALTLELAQSLYEATLISYPRTSSQKLPAKLNLKKIIEALAGNPDYAASAKMLLAQGRAIPLEGKKADPAHPAIHPTGRRGNMLADKQKKLYDLVVKRFLSCFAQSARREAQKVELLSGSETYRANGNRTTFPGWFGIYAPYVKLDEAALPAFTEGEQVGVSDFTMGEKKTQPPKRYTPASIISELERLGLGTKATRANIIETLFKRGYVEGTSIKATPFGMVVYDLLSQVAPEILDERLTHDMEKEMEKIRDGENEKKVIEDGKRVLVGILGHFEGKEKDIGFGLLSGLKQQAFSESILGKCVKCGNSLRVIPSKAGKQFVGCTGYPSCTATYPLPQNAKIIPLGKACEKCGTPMIRVIRKGKKAFEMCIDPLCVTKKDWAKPVQQSASSQPSSAPALQKAAGAPKAPAQAAAPPRVALPQQPAQATPNKPKTAPAAASLKKEAPAKKVKAQPKQKAVAKRDGKKPAMGGKK